MVEHPFGTIKARTGAGQARKPMQLVPLGTCRIGKVVDDTLHVKGIARTSYEALGHSQKR